MGSAYMTVGELSSFLMYAFWVGISIGGMVREIRFSSLESIIVIIGVGGKKLLKNLTSLKNVLNELLKKS